MTNNVLEGLIPVERLEKWRPGEAYLGLANIGQPEPAFALTRLGVGPRGQTWGFVPLRAVTRGFSAERPISINYYNARNSQ